MEDSISARALSVYVQAENADFRISSKVGLENRKDPFHALLVQYKETVLNSLVTAFGLDKALFVDRDGGNVQTIHNAENGVYANDTFMERGERAYIREDYASANYMNARRKKDFQSSGVMIDGYTGKELPKDGRTHLEHVVSAKENHDNTAFRILFEKEEMHDIINDVKNTIYTEGSLNQSKGETPLQEWMDKVSKGHLETNAERFEVDRKKASRVDRKARKYIDETIVQRKIEHYASSITQDSLKQGGAMAVRQALGLVFTEVVIGIWDGIPQVKASLQSEFSFQNFFEGIVELVKKNFARVKAKMQQIFQAFQAGFVAGVLNSVITAIINMFFTTAKNIVRIIRQAMVSVTEAVRILFFDKENRTPGERLLAAVKLLMTGAATVLGVLLEQSLSEILSTSGLGAIPYIGGVLVEVISVFSGVLLTGLLSVTLVYVLENSEIVKKLVKFINVLLEDGFKKAKKKFDKANTLLDEYIANICEIDIASLKKYINEMQCLNTALDNNNMEGVYKFCGTLNVSLQFTNSREFESFMADESTVLEI